MTDQLRKRIFKKRKVKTLMFQLTNDVCIEVNTYALIRPTVPGTPSIQRLTFYGCTLVHTKYTITTVPAKQN
jgi:hypothetical protein